MTLDVPVHAPVLHYGLSAIGLSVNIFVHFRVGVLKARWFTHPAVQRNRNCPCDPLLINGTVMFQAVPAM
jgi:hypothetical protein